VPHWTPPGTNWARALPFTPPGPVPSGSPIASYPPDFNNDGAVDQTDVNAIISFVGQGDGIPFGYLDTYWLTGQAVPPLQPGVGNPACAPWYYSKCENDNWRRFDLNDDGYVDQKDVNLVQLLVGQPYPMTTDILPPSVRFWSPWNGGTMTAGVGNYIQTIATDNQWLARVDLYVDGKLVMRAPPGNSAGEKRYAASRAKSVTLAGTVASSWRLSKGRFSAWPKGEGASPSSALLVRELQILLWGGDPASCDFPELWRKAA
jgi:hypothetical protein